MMCRGSPALLTYVSCDLFHVQHVLLFTFFCMSLFWFGFVPVSTLIMSLVCYSLYLLCITYHAFLHLMFPIFSFDFEPWGLIDLHFWICPNE